MNNAKQGLKVKKKILKKKKLDYQLNKQIRLVKLKL